MRTQFRCKIRKNKLLMSNKCLLWTTDKRERFKPSFLKKLGFDWIWSKDHKYAHSGERMNLQIVFPSKNSYFIWIYKKKSKLTLKLSHSCKIQLLRDILHLVFPRRYYIEENNLKTVFQFISIATWYIHSVNDHYKFFFFISAYNPARWIFFSIN